MQFREWMEHGRASFLFRRILSGMFPTGRLSKDGEALNFVVNLPAYNRVVTFSLDRTGLGTSNEPYVHIDFEFIEHPDDADDLHARKLQQGTVSLMHQLRSIVDAFHTVGLGVKYVPLEDEGEGNARARIYGKVMSRSGYEPVAKKDGGSYFRPAKPAVVPARVA